MMKRAERYSSISQEFTVFERSSCYKFYYILFTNNNFDLQTIMSGMGELHLEIYAEVRMSTIKLMLNCILCFFVTCFYNDR